MDFKKSEGRLWLENQEGKTIAEVLFPKEGEDDTVDITHTFVDDSLRGQGMAGKIMEETANTIRKNGQKAILTCTYAQAWFAHHKEYEDILK